MSLKIGVAAVVAVALVGCGGDVDGPTNEQAAKAYELYMNENVLIAQMGQRLEVQKWDGLTLDCAPVDGQADRVACETGGTLTVRTYQGGQEATDGDTDMAPTHDLTFEKQGEAWVPVSATAK